MKRLLSMAVALGLLLSSVAVAEEMKSGLKVGARIGAFDVTKIAGAEDDGKAAGDKLCYRCKNGSRPQVMVFTRSTDDKVVSLVKKLDDQIKKSEEAQLCAFVNLLGDSSDSAKGEAKKLAAATKVKQIPFVVPHEYENGPDNYGINPKAEVTIIFANEGKVVANHSVASVKDLNVDNVLKHVAKALN